MPKNDQTYAWFERIYGSRLYIIMIIGIVFHRHILTVSSVAIESHVWVMLIHFTVFVAVDVLRRNVLFLSILSVIFILITTIQLGILSFAQPRNAKRRRRRRRTCECVAFTSSNRVVQSPLFRHSPAFASQRHTQFGKSTLRYTLWLCHIPSKHARFEIIRKLSCF